MKREKCQMCGQDIFEPLLSELKEKAIKTVVEMMVIYSIKPQDIVDFYKKERRA